jgi:hypothetical protein
LAISTRSAGSDEAWTKLELARKPAERVEIAKEFPNTPAARWGLLQAASEIYREGFRDLPNNRDAAEPMLRRSFDLFDQVERESPPDSPQARAAALGAARALEAQNKLEKAVAQYKRVAKTWPGTDEARQAERFARELEKPENVEFYKELYAFKPPEFSLPPRGQGSLKLPFGHPPVGDSSLVPPLPLPPPPPSPASETKLPEDVFAPPAKGEAAKP